MKRRRRRLLPGVAVLSLVLFLGTAWLWVRSCWRRDQIVLYARYYAGTVPHAIGFGMADRPYFTDGPCMNLSTHEGLKPAHIFF